MKRAIKALNKMQEGGSSKSKKKKRVGRIMRRSNRVLTTSVVLNYCESKKGKRSKEEVVNVKLDNNSSEEEMNSIKEMETI